MNRVFVMRMLTGTFCLFGFLLCQSVQMSFAGIAQIEVHQKAEIDEKEIVLGRLADIRSEDIDLVNQLKNVVIASSPLPGASRTIDRDTIMMKLRQCNIDLSQIDLFVPEQVVITRQSNRISSKEIEQIVLKFIYTKLPWDKSKIRVKNIQACNEVILPTGVVTYQIYPPKNTDYLGTIPLSIQFSVDGRPEKKILVSVSIEVVTDVIVTKRPLGRNKLITGDDIELVGMDRARTPTNAITDGDYVIGKRTKRQIDAFAVLQENQIENVPIIKRGDVVLIIAESDVLKVTTLGKAKEKGCLGEVIRVENVDSRKGIYAKVIDSKSVRVEF